ncbi:hypothetical protein NKH70_30205 [Mesorhizobium sp. M0991]|uniref:hypothetical protein n=1 Tax=Mesorhizobium sp. M0991 TaxID=2957043 RepID=UPI00333DE185
MVHKKKFQREEMLSLALSCPFEGSDLKGSEASGAHVFEEAAQFGICFGVTIPGEGPRSRNH